jgi:arabinose-5-phosphate isomerase
MHTGEEIPLVRTTTPMRDVVYEMSRKRFGITGVVDAGGKLVGVISDGDLRRPRRR